MKLLEFKENKLRIYELYCRKNLVKSKRSILNLYSFKKEFYGLEVTSEKTKERILKGENIEINQNYDFEDTKRF